MKASLATKQVFSNKSLTRLLAVILLSNLSLQTAVGQQKWIGSGSGNYAQQFEVADEFLMSSGFGGQPLGDFTSTGNFNVNDDFTITGEQTFVTGDGVLYTSFSGTAAVTMTGDFDLVFVATVTVEGGTGKFAMANGTAEMTGSIRESNQSIEYEFVGQLDLPADMNKSGSIELSSLANGLGQTVAYSMQSGDGTFHVGSLAPSQIMNSVHSKSSNIVLTFDLESAPAPFTGRPFHVISNANGQLFTTLESGMGLIEIDAETGAATQHVQGDLVILGGTGIYENASGTLRMEFTTESSSGQEPVAGSFELGGFVELANPTNNQPLINLNSVRSIDEIDETAGKN